MPPDPGLYLRSLLDATSFIDIRGLQVGSGKAHRFPIDDLFMSLTTTASAEAPPERKGKGRTGPAGAGALERGTAVPLHTALSARRLVVVGDPGSGKSTFLRRVAHALCETRLGTAPEAALDRVGLDGAPFPIFVRLPELAEYIAATRGTSGAPRASHRAAWLPHFLAAAAQDDGDSGLDEEFFRRQLEGDASVVLLDGLDEAPDRVTRTSLSRLIEKLPTAYKHSQVVVTSRPGAYTDEVILSGFAQARIDPLASATADTFLERWCTALYPESTADAIRHQAELAAALSGRAEIRRMARNPVMLTALAVVHWNERRLPEQRADLYASIITWLSRSREQRPGRPTAERAVALLQELALAMHRHSEGRQVQVAKRWAAEAVASEWPDRTAKKRLTSAAQFLDDEELDSGIIVGRGGDVRFWHLTFQEYLAAKALAGRPDTELQRIVFGESRLYHPEWREVMLLLAGVLHQHQGSKTLDGFVRAVLGSLPSRSTLANRARAVGLLGAMFRDLAAVGYAPSEPRYDTLLKDVQRIFDPTRSRRIPVSTRIEAADALGQAGDPRLDPDHPAYWVTVPAGTFWMGAQNEDPEARNYDADAEGDESPVHEVQLESFRISRNLVSVAEFQRFVDGGGYDDDRYWQAGGWQRSERPNAWDDQLQFLARPVVNVSWYEALAYCAWAGVQLPSEAEWERAARGTDGRRFPWGNEPPKPSLLNYEMTVGHLTPVGIYPRGASLDGALDLAGNADEWTRSLWGKDEHGPRFEYPYNSTDGREDASAAESVLRVVRGGAFDDTELSVRAASRYRLNPHYRNNLVGFRVVVSPFSSDL